LGQLQWTPARVPGTAAAAVGADGRDFDADDWWFRSRFALESLPEGDRLILELDGIATISEVFLNGTSVLESTSMWAAHQVDVTAHVRADNELVVACRALRPLLAVRRLPRQRWRARIVEDGSLRWFRTMIFGRSPGYAPGPAPVGPWRPVRVTRRGPAGIDSFSVRTALEGDDGVIVVRAALRGKVGAAAVSAGDGVEPLVELGDGRHGAEIRVPNVQRWWPHTHGEPVLHPVSLSLDGRPVASRRVGFRTLSWSEDILTEGLDLRVNGVPIFIRGAVWTPADLISLAPSPAELRRLLGRVREAGMNMLRVVGTGAYESSTFYDLCDELGVLVWQDLMFASLDYPVSVPEFRSEVEQEARDVLAQLSGRPSLAVVCGNHEIEQQPAMLGQDPRLGRDDFWDEMLPRLADESGADCAYIRSTPCGGALPFHPDKGIAHYFGIGGYFRRLDDVRRAGVRFAAECLPFANVPDEVKFPVHHPKWKEGVLRDAGPAWAPLPGWDFDDARDFYFAQVFGIDPLELRRIDHDRYLELSRVASGEVMAEVMGEWRRDASPCRGAIVLWFKDMVPGAGFGVLDHAGTPKVAYHYLRRSLAPVAVWTTDEATAGVAVHAVNDGPQPLRARLRVALYKDLEVCVDEAEEEVEIPAHGSLQRNVEAMIGRFVDAACCYLFGPPGHDAIVASLTSDAEAGTLLSQSMRFPSGRPLTRESAAQLGLAASVDAIEDRNVAVRLCSRRLAYGVRVRVPGFVPDDDCFSLEPGRERVVRLRAEDPHGEFTAGAITALNLQDRVSIANKPA
jgi:beta-mannosidase